VTAIRSVRAAEGKFVQISNDLIRNEELSVLARFIVCYVLSLPPDHHFTAEWLETKLPGYGTRSIRAALNELKACGHMKVTRKSLGRGRWEWDQIISDGPIDGVSSERSGSDETTCENTSPQVSSSEHSSPDDGSSDDGRSDKRSNTEDPKDVGPVDLASRRARAKAASATLTVSDAIAAIRRAATIEYGADEANEITDGEALGLFFTYVQGRRPRDLVAYIGKIFADAPYLDTLLSNSEAVCTRCQQWDSNCGCPAA
jgi:hypothetical protein